MDSVEVSPFVHTLKYHLWGILVLLRLKVEFPSETPCAQASGLLTGGACAFSLQVVRTAV